MKDNTSCQTSDQSSFLWRLLYFYFVKDSVDGVQSFVASMYEQKFEFTTDFEDLLLKLWETSDTSCIVQIAKKALELSLFSSEERVFLVAALVEHEEIDVNHATLLLRFDDQREYANLSPQVKRVVDVAWLVKEDAEDGVMTPSDDTMLMDALKKAKRFIYSRLI